MPHGHCRPRALQPLSTSGTTNSDNISNIINSNKMIELKRCRKSLSKRLVNSVNHLRNELEAEVFIEQLRISREEEMATQEVVNKINQLFAENDLGGFKVKTVPKVTSQSKMTGSIQKMHLPDSCFCKLGQTKI